MSATNAAELMIVLLCLPGKEPQPAGILLLDPVSNHLEVKLKTDIKVSDMAVSEFWTDLADDLKQRVRENGGQQVAEWLEMTASNVLQVSSRTPVDLKGSTITEAVFRLYAEHIGS